MVEYSVPKAVNKLPELKTEFKDPAEKGAHVQELMSGATKAMQDADQRYN